MLGPSVRTDDLNGMRVDEARLSEDASDASLFETRGIDPIESFDVSITRILQLLPIKFVVALEAIVVLKIDFQC